MHMQKKDTQKMKAWKNVLANIDANVRPQDDFYHYTSGGWMKRNVIPPHESRWSSFLKLRFDTDKKTHSILKEISGKRNLGKKTPEKMIHDFYNSGMDTKKRTGLGMQPLSSHIVKIQNIKTVNDMIKTVAKLHTIGVGVLWGATVDQDSKKSDTHILHFYQNGLGMPDRDYYLHNDAESKRVRNAYKEHLRTLFQLMGKNPNDAREAMETVMRIEILLAKASMIKEDFYDVEKTYHKKTIASLIKSAPNIPWKIYFAGIGITEPKEVVVMQPDFLSAIHTMFETVTLPEWKTYLTCHLINEYASALTPSFERHSFAFYGKVLSGTKRMSPQWRRVLSTVNGGIGEILGQIYVKRHFNKESKRKMNEIVDDLFTAYEARIKALPWMNPATKRKALKKLHSINRKIGFPDKWKGYRGLVIEPDTYVHNIMRSYTFEYRRNMRKLGKPIDKTEWGMYPHTVNAYFSPTLNDIVFPAAILQPPFFDLCADDALNYGAIGMIIGHEMTHGFDDDGSKFDEHGNMKNWWTSHDRDAFIKKTTLLEKQFNTYKVSGGLSVNGKLTLGENVADLGGVSMALDAYRLHCAKTKLCGDINGFTPTQRFFLGFALFGQELRRPEAEKAQVLTDPHSPGIFRINGSVSNMKEFYEAFNVKKGDKLYRPSKIRAEIW